jgi:hypothetical protein
MSKCPFAAALITELAACRHAEQVVRRGGAEFDCRSAGEHERCQAVHEALKIRALTAFGVEDDLTSMPHSVLVKIQCGGLRGLQRIAGEPEGPIADIAELRARVADSTHALDDPRLADAMTGFRVERRGRRRA